MSASEHMQIDSHSRTWISILAEAVESYRKEHDLSREAMGQLIVDAHEKSGSQKVTGISFDPPNKDPYTRMKTNADRIWRWLDEISKDSNLLPSNFVKSILLAMPMGLRLRTVNTLLIELELTAKPIPRVQHLLPLDMLRHILHETSEVTNAYAQLVDGIDPGELEQALETTTTALAALNEAKMVVQNMLLERSHGKK